jgi:hypothetical protein
MGIFSRILKSLIFNGLGGVRVKTARFKNQEEKGADSLAGKSLGQDVPRMDWDWKSQLRLGRGRFGAARPRRPTGKRDKTSRNKIQEKKPLPHSLHLKLKT